ncbi:hypothetical protein niasHT_029447 [Heterodera trifolii]|uniref:Uncharacterized protein n=1 Tax=Heterodera trifolii TaxID=157864 RepID=A0ABD2KQ91_9BILA
MHNSPMPTKAPKMCKLVKMPRCKSMKMLNDTLENVKQKFPIYKHLYRIQPRDYYRIWFIKGDIENPTKKMQFVTDEKGKITWHFFMDIMKNKFTPRGFRRLASLEPITILVENCREKYVLARFDNYAQMKKQMKATKGKLYHKNSINFYDLMLLSDFNKEKNKKAEEEEVEEEEEPQVDGGEEKEQ